MMLTYDLEAKCHRIEIFVMPSYDQINNRAEFKYQIITLPYKVDLNLAPGSVLNYLITGHFHQLKD
jgi:hypothetical protein